MAFIYSQYQFFRNCMGSRDEKTPRAKLLAAEQGRVSESDAIHWERHVLTAATAIATCAQAFECSKVPFLIKENQNSFSNRLLPFVNPIHQRLFAFSCARQQYRPYKEGTPNRKYQTNTFKIIKTQLKIVKSQTTWKFSILWLK